jgi:hypothetical protein
MISKLKIYTIFLLPFWLMLQFESDNNGFKTIEHTVLVNHRGEGEPVVTTLTEVQDSQGLPVEYYMNVESVICLEQVCKVIPVRLHWNNIGVYQKYELQANATLEKYKDDFFVPEDYKKLNTILANTESPFKEVYLEDILTVPDELNEDVDAVSGATALELDEKDTVPGAALTCFTLWHWANGDIISVIKNQTGASASIPQLQDYILAEDANYFHIALDELKKRKLHSKSIVKIIIKKILQDDTLLRVAFSYFKNTSSDLYLYATERLLFEGGKEQKLAAMQSLRETSFVAPKSYLDNFSSEMTKMNSFQEISILLGLMESKNPNSKLVIDNAFQLLDSDFLIARRAYWFLSNQQLDAEQKQLVEEFFIKHKNQL